MIFPEKFKQEQFLHMIPIDASNRGPLLEKDISSGTCLFFLYGISSLNPDGIVPSQRLSGSQHCSQISFNKMGRLGSCRHLRAGWWPTSHVEDLFTSGVLKFLLICHPVAPKLWCLGLLWIPLPHTRNGMLEAWERTLVPILPFAFSKLFS